MSSALGAAATDYTPAAEEPTEAVRLGVASYSLRNKSLAETLAAMKTLNTR